MNIHFILEATYLGQLETRGFLYKSYKYFIILFTKE